MQERLTDSELYLMKVVWESENPLTVQEIMAQVNQRFGKQWKVQTISTFLGRMVKKEYLDMERKGRTFYYYPLVSEERYRREELKKYVDFWGEGRLDGLLASFARTTKLTEEEKDSIRRMLDAMD